MYALAVAKMLTKDNAEEVSKILTMAKGSFAVPIATNLKKICKSSYGLMRQTGVDAWLQGKKLNELSSIELDKEISTLEKLAELSEDYGKAYKASVKRVRDRHWKDFLEKGPPKAILDGTLTFSRKQLPQEVIDHYMPLFEHASAKVVNLLLDKNIGYVALLTLFNGAWSSVKHEEGVYSFDDVTHYLGESCVLQESKELAFRIDSQIDHLLIDEFQDTSLPQFKLLKPLICEIKSSQNERSLFVVGDPKQSLYGFRGGEPELLRGLAKDVEVKITKLPTSYRCAPAVLDAVNRVFGKANFAPLLQEHSEDGVNQWLESFEQHVSADSRKPGRAVIHTTGLDPQASKPHNPSLECMVDSVANIVRDIHSKNKNATVGILVRKNTKQQIQKIVHALRSHKEKPIFATEHRGNPLTDSPLVTVVLSALLLADHPGNTIALFHVSTSPLGEQLGLEPTSNRKDAEQVSADLRRDIASKGLGKVVSGLAKPLFAGATNRDANRLWQLVELATTSNTTTFPRISDFVSYVKKKHVYDPANSLVQVMTVHNAKGLGFDAVVVCDLHEPLWTSPELLTDKKPCETPTAVSVREHEKFNSIIDNQESMWKQEKSKQVQEALSLLYVAMTRAKHELHLVIPPRPKNVSAKSYSPPTSKVVDRFLRQTFDLGEHLEPNKIVWESELNEKDCLEHIQEEDAVGASEEIQISLVQSKSQKIFATTSPSSLEGGGKVNIGERFKGGTNTAFDWGTLVHKWFEDIEWFKSIPSEEELIATALPEEAERLGEEQLHQAAIQFLKALESNQFQEVLKQPNKNTSVYREQDFAVRVEKGAKLATVTLEEATDIRGTVDRLVVQRSEEGEVVSAEIIDWKTDSLEEEELDEKIRHYAPQLASYKIAAARLLGIPVQNVTTKLAFVSTGEVHDISFIT